MSSLSIHNAQGMVSLAELRAFAVLDTGRCRNFIESGPSWAQSIVRDITHYSNPFPPRYTYMLSVNVHLSWAVAESLLPRIDSVGKDTMQSQKAIWMLSSGSVNLERYTQVFDAPHTSPVYHSTPQYYFLDFLFKELPSERATYEGLHRLFQYLLTAARLTDENSPSMPFGYGRQTVGKGLVYYEASKK